MDERVPPLRIKVGHKRSLSPWVFVFILVFFMGILLVVFLWSPLSRIEQLQIQGNQLMSEEEIMQTTQLYKGVSYFHTNLMKAKDRLEKRSEIQHAEIKRSFPNKVYIKIKEFPVVAYIQWNDGQFAPVLLNGTILPHRRTSEIIQPWPVIEKKDHANPTLQLALRNFIHVPKPIRQEIEFIHLVENRPDQVVLVSKNHHQIFIRAGELHQKMIYYPYFRKHPEGRLYFLQSIWFTPERKTNGS